MLQLQAMVLWTELRNVRVSLQTPHSCPSLYWPMVTGRAARSEFDRDYFSLTRFFLVSGQPKPRNRERLCVIHDRTGDV